MRFTHGVNLNIFCDSCGNQINLELSDFYIDMSYGGEDECYGCPDDEYKLSMEYPNQWVKLRSYLAQDRYEFCNECRCNNNFAKEFENAARASRVALIRKLIDSKVLPEFSETTLSRKEKLKVQLTELEAVKRHAIKKMELIEKKRNVTDTVLVVLAKELTTIEKKINTINMSLGLLDEL